MEDYTYDYKKGLILGSHMLEVCPCIAAEKPKIEVHKLGIGGKEPPARLVFEGRSGDATAISLIDVGGRMRLIAQKVECVKPPQTMPNLPVARTMWKPMPDLKTGAECWITAGGAHHTVLSYDVSEDILRDFAKNIGIELVIIDSNTTPAALEKELMLGDIIWRR
jgi:L-arabinose isomerase